MPLSSAKLFRHITVISPRHARDTPVVSELYREEAIVVFASPFRRVSDHYLRMSLVERDLYRTDRLLEEVLSSRIRYHDAS